MRELLKIALNLFAISLVASALLGVVFIFTEAAKKENEKLRMEESMTRYLPEEAVAAKDVEFARIYRYLVETESGANIGYVLPVREGQTLLVVTPEGETVDLIPLPEGTDLEDETIRDETLAGFLPKSQLTYADEYVLALRGGKRIASFIQGRTQGFKTWVKMLVALNTADVVMGLEILEHEEDPGLGAEIEQEYFRNQFIGRTVAGLNKLDVTKLPLPADYKKALEHAKWSRLGLTPEEAGRILQKYEKDDIYAITGSTISSVRVTGGVKKLVRAFVKRMEIIERVAGEQKIPVVF